MSTASAQKQAYYTITARDGTNVTLTKATSPGERPADVALPTTITIAHNDDLTFWGTVAQSRRYSVGIDLAG